MKKFDDSPFDVIVFDEIFLNNIRMLAKIKKYAEDNPDKIVCATGDTTQNKPVEVWSDIIDHKEYAKHCISVIFPNQINLTENKRLKEEADKLKLKHLKEDMFNEAIPPKTTINKYFRND
jgi:hypothetical protein